MARFIDRDKELAQLEREYEAPRSAMVVLYGRRRVGKTALISEFIKNKKAIYYLATQESESQNRTAFKDITADILEMELLRDSNPKSWDVIFRAIADQAKEEKIIIALDEFQYLGKANPAFPSVFQKIWDTILKDANVMVILCGSLIGMMEAQTLNYTSPLYGRRTAQIRMQQIPFAYYHEFYPDMDSRNLIEHYAVTGGVPKYIELFPGKDIYAAIREHILNTSGFLYEEPTFLLSNEVSEIGSYFSIIKAIAAGNQKLGRIATVLEVPQTSLSTYLKTLVNLDILEREVPVTEKDPERSKRGLYKIKDNFIRFWFRFVYPYRSYLERGETEYVERRMKQNFIDGHAAYAFEAVCTELMWKLGAEDCWPFMIERVGRWWDNKNNEIDVVALDEMGNNIVFGECKYWKEPVGVNVLRALQEKTALVDWNKGNRTEWFVLFSASGFTDELRKAEKEEGNLKLVEI